MGEFGFQRYLIFLRADVRAEEERIAALTSVVGSTWVEEVADAIDRKQRRLETMNGVKGVRSRVR